MLLVSSAKGGVGKSLVAVNIAYAMKHVYPNYQVGILDADIYGPSIPKMTGLVGQQPQINKRKQTSFLISSNNHNFLFCIEKMMLPLTNYGVKCMSMGFLVAEEDPIVWRGLMVMQAVERLLRSVNWGELDLLVVDMPPGTGDTQLSIVQNINIDGVMIVTTPQQVALADVVRGTKMYHSLGVPILGFVQNMATYQCPCCSHVEHIFGNDVSQMLSTKLSLEHLVDIPIDPQLCKHSDAGCPIVVKDINSTASKIFYKLAEKIKDKLAI